MYKAIKSFVGKISMVEGEVKEIVDKELIKDLTKAGYIEEVKPIKATKSDIVDKSTLSDEIVVKKKNK